MIGTCLFFDIFVLLAASGRPRSRKPDYDAAGGNAPRKRGRQRYAPTGRTGDGQQPLEDVLPAVPPLTNPNGPFPTYFTCRHTYEETLVEEIKHYSPSVEVSSPYPGLVRAEGLPEDSLQKLDKGPLLWDPVYALQWLPQCRIIECQNSIKGLARAIAEADGFSKLLVGAPRGSLSIHALVPGMCKGQKDPILQRRSYLVAEAVEGIWKSQFPAARKPKQPSVDGIDKTTDDNTLGRNDRKADTKSSPLLLQVLLLSPDVAAVSLAPCQPSTGSLQLWPNPHYPVGMARVDIRDHKMPSSAYRKLLEAFGCWGLKPSNQDTFVDLGASPGGWTLAVLLYCDNLLDSDEEEDATMKSRSDGSEIHVYAVDRSPLDRKLMKDPRVTFLQGDAFTFEPEQSVTWMISDIISYPERIVELVDLWCRKELAANMIITMKFQGSEPSWDCLDKAIQVAESYQYQSRAKHFFNNKNEVTLMLRRENGPSGQQSISTIPSFYKRVRTSVYV